MIQRSSMTALKPLQPGMASRATRTRPQQAYLSIALIIGIAAVLCLYLYQTSKITVKDFGIQGLQADYVRLQRENSNRLARFAFEQSLEQMNVRAEKAGYLPITTVHYIMPDFEKSRHTVVFLPVEQPDQPSKSIAALQRP